MKTKCYSVRLQSLRRISPLCYEAISFDGGKDLIPASQVFGQDYEVQKSDAFWISAWILEKKNLQYSSKKEGWYNPGTRRVEPKISVTIETHVPMRHMPEDVTADEKLVK